MTIPTRQENVREENKRQSRGLIFLSHFFLSGGQRSEMSKRETRRRIFAALLLGGVVVASLFMQSVPAGRAKQAGAIDFMQLGADERENATAWANLVTSPLIQTGTRSCSTLSPSL